MLRSLFDSFMGGPWFVICVLTIIAIGIIYSIIHWLVSEDDGCEEVDKKTRKYYQPDYNHSSIYHTAGDKANPNSIDWSR